MSTPAFSIPAAIRDRISAPHPRVWTPEDFADLGPRTAVDQALHRLVASGALRRIVRGFYDIPQDNRLTGKPTYPNPRDVIDALARKGKVRVVVDGLTAANDLGLTDAVPARIGVLTDGRLRPITLGNLTLDFQSAAPSRLYWAGRPAMRFVQALHWLRDMLPSDDGSLRKRFVSILKDPDHGQAIQNDLRDGLSAMPEWMRVIVRNLLQQVSAGVPQSAKRGKPARRAGTAPYHSEEEGFTQPMIEGFQTVLAASDEERRDLFVGAADRLRTNEQNIEKDFWVCWTLDALFNDLEAGGPRLLFKGGTSLSKGYGLIERFSEDIDITVFREDIGQPATFEELEAMSGKKRNARLEAIKAACQEYIQGPMLERLSALLQQTLKTADMNPDRARLEPDPDDPDGQSFTVLVETGAGKQSAFSDHDYELAGAQIKGFAADVWSLANIVVKVKEPIEKEYGFFREGLVLFTYLHLAPLPELTERLLTQKVIGIAYETIRDRAGTLPLLTPMSEIAGRMSVQVGASYLEREKGGRGVLLGGVPGVPPANVCVIGGGIVGTNAAKIAVGMGARVTIVDLNLNRLRELDDIFNGKLFTLASNSYNIERAVQEADLVIGGVLIPGAAAPQIVTKEMVATMKRGAVIVDVAIDQGGCIETARPTTHSNPSFEVNGVVHYCVTNMPAAVPNTSTPALTNATFPFVLRLAQKGAKAAIQQDDGIRDGVNTYEGTITCEAVAVSQTKDWKPVRELIA